MALALLITNVRSHSYPVGNRRALPSPACCSKRRCFSCLMRPTNHLDIAALAWLENYLSNYNCAILLVSHDRQFMDAFASEIWELEGGQLTRYRGNFSHYRTQRDAHRERQLKVFSAQQVTLRRDQEFIRKHLGSRLTAQGPRQAKAAAYPD